MIEIVLGKVAAPGFVSACGVPCAAAATAIRQNGSAGTKKSPGQ
jgi:hypothetical protein